MFRPSPVPLAFILWSSFSMLKYLNNLLRSDSLIPIPVSSISILSHFFIFVSGFSAYWLVALDVGFSTIEFTFLSDDYLFNWFPSAFSSIFSGYFILLFDKSSSLGATGFSISIKLNLTDISPSLVNFKALLIIFISIYFMRFESVCISSGMLSSTLCNSFICLNLHCS